jgi:hypothetical protein
MIEKATSKATNTGYTLITLLNYDAYQGGENSSSSIAARIEPGVRSSIEPASSQHRTDTIKKEEKKKHEKITDAAASASAAHLPAQVPVQTQTPAGQHGMPLSLAEHRTLFLKFGDPPKYHAGNFKEALRLEKQYGVDKVLGWVRRFFDAPGQWWTEQQRFDFDAFSKASTISWLIASAAAPAGTGKRRVSIAEAWADQQEGDVVIR